MKFTDSPYFLLDHYIDTVNQQSTDDIKSRIETLWPVIFTDMEIITEWQDYNDVVWNFEYETVEGSYSKKQVNYSYDESYLMGANKCIIARGGRIIELFVKDDDYGFIEVHLTPPWDDYADGNFFQFHKHITLPYQYGSTLTETISGNHFYFEVYTPNVTFDPDDINGKEIYFRKDSEFHNWLITYAKDYFVDLWGHEFVIRNYVNTDKQFIYFGKIFHKRDAEYHVEFYGMKDFVEKAVPEHQRTPNFKEFLSVYFDRVHQESFNLLKNVWSMIDPFEVDEKFLGYLARFYNIDIDEQLIDTQNKREFIDELPNYLKRKGSYSSFYAAWKALTQGTVNNLNIYEKWIDSYLLDTSMQNIPLSSSDYVDVLYTDQYTSPLSGDNIITPHYKVQIDLSTEPIEYESILSKGVINSLITQWEDLRPVNKVSEYEIVISPEVDLSGNYKSLYLGDQEKYNTNVLSKVKRFSITVENAYIQLFGGSSTSFSVTHNLNTNNLFIRCYTDDFEEIVPKEVNFIDLDEINVVFENPVNGFMLIKKPDLTVNQLEELTETWIVKHHFNQKEVYVEFNQDNEKLYADELLLIDEEFLQSDLKRGAVNISKPDMVFIQNTDSDTWNIEHNLGYKGILIGCFDINNNEIIPEDIQFIDINNSVIIFEEAISGYAILVSVGSPLFADMLLEEIVNEEGEIEYVLPNYEVSSTIDDFETSSYQGRVSEATETTEFLFVTIELPQEMELTIREIKIYNKNILFYTECGEIHKPMGVKMKLDYKINKYITEGTT